MKMESVASTISSYLTAPVQILLLLLGIGIIRMFLRKKLKKHTEEPTQDEPLPMEKRDFTIKELQPFNGKDNERILIAVNSKVFDVTRGKSFYGPDGPYSMFAGHDASRGLATFSIDASTVKDEYDDLSDLNSMQVESMQEWEMQFTEKYDYVGKLLKPGEKHTNYKAEESEDEAKPESDKKLD